MKLYTPVFVWHSGACCFHLAAQLNLEISCPRSQTDLRRRWSRWCWKQHGLGNCQGRQVALQQKKTWYLAFSISVIIPSFDATGKFCVHLRPRVLQSFERMVKCLSNLYFSTRSELISLFEWFKYLFRPVVNRTLVWMAWFLFSWHIPVCLIDYLLEMA